MITLLPSPLDPRASLSLVRVDPLNPSIPANSAFIKASDQQILVIARRADDSSHPGPLCDAEVPGSLLLRAHWTPGAAYPFGNSALCSDVFDLVLDPGSCTGWRDLVDVDWDAVCLLGYEWSGTHQRRGPSHVAVRGKAGTKSEGRIGKGWKGDETRGNFIIDGREQSISGTNLEVLCWK